MLKFSVRVFVASLVFSFAYMLGAPTWAAFLGCIIVGNQVGENLHE